MRVTCQERDGSQIARCGGTIHEPLAVSTAMTPLDA
jgi:hypothetical protein